MTKLTAFPELFIGIAGPIGVDIDAITSSISRSLIDVGYDPHVIKLTSLMTDYPAKIERVDETDFHAFMNYKMDYADALCEENNDLSFLSRIAIKAIKAEREIITEDVHLLPEKIAYIVRQFKRPEEIALMRSVYGKRFILVSAYGSAESRRSVLQQRQKKSNPTKRPEHDASSKADQLIERDASETHKFGGQQLRDTFHLADVFIDGISKQNMDLKLTRFTRSFFGLNTAAPTKDEYGMYAAKSASLRSCDLSRQIGAAIFTQDGEIVSQGCNEVPKAFGGTYWDLEEPDYRDVKVGHDPNDEFKKELVRNIIERLWDEKMLSNKAKSQGSVHKLTDSLVKKASVRGGKDGALVGSAVMDLTEFGRVVHAEMCAICDAARLGRSVKGTTLYCTTFPCHNCTKHILAAGINRVVYMEPYPKSKAKDLHRNEIEIEKESSERVAFVPFLGIAPYRYRDIFLKEGKRKSKSGVARTWFADTDAHQPMIDPAFSSYPELENEAFLPLLGKFETGEKVAAKPVQPASSRPRPRARPASSAARSPRAKSRRS